jgi:hypothetical protein
MEQVGFNVSQRYDDALGMKDERTYKFIAIDHLYL